MNRQHNTQMPMYVSAIRSSQYMLDSMRILQIVSPLSMMLSKERERFPLPEEPVLAHRFPLLYGLTLMQEPRTFLSKEAIRKMIITKTADLLTGVCRQPKDGGHSFCTAGNFNVLCKDGNHLLPRGKIPTRSPSWSKASFLRRCRSQNDPG